MRFLMVVRRERIGTFQALREAFSPESVTVILDRRVGERRRRAEEISLERRWAERRGTPAPSWEALGIALIDLERQRRVEP